MGIDCLDFLYGSRQEKFPARTNDRTVRSRFLFVLFFSQRKEHVSPLIKEKDMSFSHRRENDEKSRRDSRLGLSSCYWEAYTHGSKGVAVLAELAQATTRRAESNCCWKLRARRRKSARIALTARSACSAVDARVYECKHVSLPCIFLKIHRTESKE